MNYILFSSIWTPTSSRSTLVGKIKVVPFPKRKSGSSLLKQKHAFSNRQCPRPHAQERILPQRSQTLKFASFRTNRQTMRLWTGKGDTVSTSLHRLCLHKMVSSSRTLITLYELQFTSRRLCFWLYCDWAVQSDSSFSWKQRYGPVGENSQDSWYSRFGGVAWRLQAGKSSK